MEILNNTSDRIDVHGPDGSIIASHAFQIVPNPDRKAGGFLVREYTDSAQPKGNGWHSPTPEHAQGRLRQLLSLRHATLKTAHGAEAVKGPAWLQNLGA